MLLTLADILNIVSKSLSIKEDDTSTRALIKNAANEAYMILCNVDKRISTAYIPIINGIATLPETSLGVVKCTPALSNSDRAYGNVIMTDKTGVLEILYFYARELLVEDEDELDLHITLQQALINYICFIVSNTNGEQSKADGFYNAYLRNISQFERVDIAMPETIMEV